MEKVIVSQVVKKFPRRMQPEGSLPCSQGAATCPVVSQLKFKLHLLLSRNAVITAPRVSNTCC